eukprot:TRINITY_DN2205_c0_g1_i7.p1 TRINITY_DN2205_c0_g1~~TRINITY_DN2205_c0_g1_i7.p1  ORF type:complete len:581 (-),score=94.85 TRINITY_DN2205_c0_g1_i7:233-1975(-)
MARNLTITLILLVSLLFTGGQSQPQTVSGSASLSVSASSLQDLQSQIQEEAEKAFADIDASTGNLDSAVQQLTQVVAQAVGGILINLVQQGNVDAEAAGSEISQAIGGALSSAASSVGGDLANLDVNSITTNISSSVTSTINNASPTASASELTQSVAQEVLNTLGSALASATGGTFSASVSVTEVATAAPISLDLVSVDVSGAAAEILQLMVNGSFSAAVAQMSEVLLGGGSDQISEVITTAVDQGLNASLISTLAALYQDETFPILPFSVALGSAYDQVGNQQALIELLGQAFTQVNLSGNYPNLRDALYYAFTSQGGSVRRAYDQALSAAIEASGCTSIAEVLAAAKGRADQLGLGTLFMIAIQNNPDINACLQVGVELQVSIDILGQLQDTQRAVELLLQAITEGNFVTVSNLIIQAVLEGQVDELTQVLTQILCDSSIPQDQLVDSIVATVDSADNANVTKVLGDILASAPCNNQASNELSLKIYDLILLQQGQGNSSEQGEGLYFVGPAGEGYGDGNLESEGVGQPEIEYEIGENDMDEKEIVNFGTFVHDIVIVSSTGSVQELKMGWLDFLKP